MDALKAFHDLCDWIISHQGDDSSLEMTGSVFLTALSYGDKLPHDVSFHKIQWLCDKIMWSACILYDSWPDEVLYFLRGQLTKTCAKGDKTEWARKYISTFLAKRGILNRKFIYVTYPWGEQVHHVDYIDSRFDQSMFE